MFQAPAMMQILVKDDDVISLNIGGKNMAASRSTLCQVEGLLLASMFSGRWEDRLKKDKQGNVLLDFNPDCFKLILNYLRAKKTETPRSQTKKPKPPEEEKSNYWNLVEYLGLYVKSYSLVDVKVIAKIQLVIAEPMTIF